MTKLEDEVRRLLDDAAPEPPAGSAPKAAPVRRRRLSYTPLLAAAVVVAFAVTIVVGRSRHEQPSHNFGPNTDIQVGMQVLGYYGISVTVPTHFTVGQYQCSYPRTDTVNVATGVVLHCPQMSGRVAPPLGYTAVSLSPDRENPQHPMGTPTRIDGVDAARSLTSNGGTPFGVITVASRDVTVSVFAPTAARVRAILDTVRITPVDTRRCVDKAAPLTGTSNSESDELVPGSPVSAVVCEYNNWSKPYRLLASRTLTRTQTAVLVARLNAGSDSSPSSTTGGPALGRYVFTYTAGRTRTVDAVLDVQPTPVTDGHRTMTVDLQDGDLPDAFG